MRVPPQDMTRRQAGAALLAAVARRRVR